MTSPIDIVAKAIRVADGKHTMGAGQLAEVAVTALTSDAIVDNAVAALRGHSWTEGDVADISDRNLRGIVRVVLRSVGGAS